LSSSSIATARSWWAGSRRSARATLVGAIALTTALAVVCGIVWFSPGGPVDSAGKTVARLTAADRILSERNELLSENVALTRKLESAWAKGGSSDAQVAELRQQLADVKAQLASAQSAAGAAKAAAGSGTKAPAATKPSAGVAPAAITAPPKDQVAAPANPYFGLYTAQAPFNWAGFDSVAHQTGELPGAVGFFTGWDQDYRASGVTAAWKRGMVPIMTWESRPIGANNAQKDDPDYTLAKIIGGQYDDYLHRFAADVRTTGLPVVIRLDHEMNGDWYPWSERANTNSAGQFVQMWKHVHDIFEQEGANDDVIWLWSPNRVDRVGASAYQTPAYLASLYPGDDYVDWIGMSGYLRHSDETPTFATTFGKTLAQLRSIAPQKKIFLSEVGATETGGNKPAWITSFFQGLADPANADIVGFGWFDLTVTSFAEGDTSTNDWRIESTRQSLAAFVAGYSTPGSRFASRPF
jgi:mannan endo-1,4-beta-mannosidase